MAVNKKLLTKWCDALTSRKYKQTKGSLRDNDGYCCLGVLCDIVDNSKWDYTQFDNSTSFAPDDIFCSLKLPEEVTQEKLAGMNDEGKKFYQIARFLRKYLSTKSMKGRKND